MSDLTSQYIIAQEEHDYNKKYEEGTIVKHTIDDTVTTYVARKNVPQFISILDEKYWKKMASTEEGGTVDYDNLKNKPTINGVKLEGNITTNDLGIDNKFKGWYDSSSYLPSNPVVGDYAYVKGATASDPAAIYECTTAGTWSDSGRTVDTSNVQTFASGEEVNEVHIVNDLDTGGVNDVLSAEQGVILSDEIGSNNTQIFFKKLDAVIPAESARVYYAITTTTEDINAELTVNGLSGVLEFSNSGWTALGNYEFEDGVMTQIKIPKNCRYLFFYTQGRVVTATNINFSIKILCGTISYRLSVLETEIPDKIELTSNKEYTNGAFDLSNLGLSKGNIDAEGNVVSNSYFMVTKEIQVQPLSRFEIKTTYSDSRIKIVFYNKRISGEKTLVSLYSYVDNESSGGIKCINQLSTVVPVEANTAIICFARSYNGNVSQAIVESNTTLVCTNSVKSIQEKAEFENSFKNGVCRVNDYTTWRRACVVYNGYWTYGSNNKRIQTVIPIQLQEGHKYDFYYSNQAMLLSSLSGAAFELQLYDDYKLGNNIQSTRFNHGNAHRFIAPSGIKYLSVILTFAEDVADADIETKGRAIDFYLFDCDYNHNVGQSAIGLADIDFESGKRYAQGMAISNGFVFSGFQTYASATDQTNIEIRDLNTMNIIQKLMVGNNDYHWNNIYFGEKYEESDVFGVLWATYCSSSKCYLKGYRIGYNENVESPFSFTEVYSIEFDYPSGYTFADIFVVKNRKQIILYYTNLTTNNDSHFVLLEYSGELNSSTVFTTVKEYSMPVFKYLQGGLAIDNDLWIVAAVPNACMGILDIDITGGKVNSKTDFFNGYFDIPIDEEGQSIARYNGNVYLQTTKHIYKLNV